MHSIKLKSVVSAAFFCLGVKNKCMNTDIYIAAELVKSTCACSVSGPPREFSLCSVKPCASKEPSIILYFPLLGIKALSPRYERLVP